MRVPKAADRDFPGRYREIISDPVNLLIRRVPMAGVVAQGMVTLHNGLQVPVAGPGSYYDTFSDILIFNRGVHEPLEEFAFQQMLPLVGPAPTMLELGAYWAHYSMWMQQRHPDARNWMVEAEAANVEVGRQNFIRNQMRGTFIQSTVGTGGFEVDAFMASDGAPERLSVLHSDIQGFELQMLLGATQTFALQKVDYAFISTHSQDIHAAVVEIMTVMGYRIEVSSDFAHSSTSMDGLVLASHPDRPAVLPEVTMLGREEICGADPAVLVRSLLPLLEGASTGP